MYTHPMRTTVDLDPSDLATLKAMAKHEKATLGQVIGRLLRAARTEPEIRMDNGLPLLVRKVKGKRVTTEHVKELLESDPY